MAGEGKILPGVKTALQLILATMKQAAQLTGRPIHPPISISRPPFENGLIGRLIESGNDSWQLIAIVGRWAAEKEKKAFEDEQATKKELVGNRGENGVDDDKPTYPIIDTARDGRQRLGGSKCDQ